MLYKDKKALVCGMGKSGNSAAHLLLSHGAKVTLMDSNNSPDVDNALLQNKNVYTCFGQCSDDIASSFDFLVLSPGIPLSLPFIIFAKSQSIPIIGELELAASHCKAPIIAITGTNGKTTTTTMVGQIMEYYANDVHVVGNIGTPFCSVAQVLSQKDIVVAEVSSFQLETIKNFRPKISAVLNMTQDHLNRHITMENYIAAKSRIFENQKKGDLCILNHDNSITRNMAKDVQADIIFFSTSPLEHGVFVENDHICINWGGYNGKIIKTSELAVPGIHNIENAMAAAAMAAAANVPKGIIASGLKDFKAVAHRLELVSNLNGISFYNDSKATNVDSAIKAIESIEAPIILIAGGRDKGQDFDPLIKSFKGRVKHFIIIGEAASKLQKACHDHNFTSVELASDMETAVIMASKKAKPKEVVLLSPACASFDMFLDFEERGRVFKECVKNLGY